MTWQRVWVTLEMGASFGAGVVLASPAFLPAESSLLLGDWGGLKDEALRDQRSPRRVQPETELKALWAATQRAEKAPPAAAQSNAPSTPSGSAEAGGEGQERRVADLPGQ